MLPPTNMFIAAHVVVNGWEGETSALAHMGCELCRRLRGQKLARVYIHIC